MTKEEAINLIIEEAKRGNDHAYTDFCGNYADCSDCPLLRAEECRNIVFNGLIERLIKAEEQSKSFEKTCYKLQQALEEKAETNLEHYFNAGDVIVYSGQQYVYLNDNCWDAYVKGKTSHIVEWLLEPYKPPKYKLSKFEYDLIQSFNNYTYTRGGTIYMFGCLTEMQEKGYFKGIPSDIPFEDILDNCEVVNNEID